MGTYKTHFLQWIVLGLTEVLISASEHRVEGNVGNSVLLSCSCPCQERPREFLRWQRDEHPLLKQDHSLKIEKEYENRVTIFTNEDKDNCSLSLSNINVADNGKYSCFFKCGTLEYKNIYLNVVAKYNVCMNPVQHQDSVGSNEKLVYQCKASDGYPIGQIRWKLNGHYLNGSLMETHKDNSTDLYTLTSSLAIELDKCVELLCLVEHEDQVYHANSSSTCTDGKSEPHISPEVVGLSVGVGGLVVAGVLLGMFLLTRLHPQGVSTLFFKQQSDTEIQDIEMAMSLKADEDFVPLDPLTDKQQNGGMTKETETI